MAPEGCRYRHRPFGEARCRSACVYYPGKPNGMRLGRANSAEMSPDRASSRVEDGEVAGQRYAVPHGDTESEASFLEFRT